METNDFFIIDNPISPETKIFHKWMEYIKNKFQSDDGNLQLGKTLDYLWGQIAKNTDNPHIVSAYNHFIRHCHHNGVPIHLLNEAANLSCENTILEYAVKDLAKTDNLLSLLKQTPSFEGIAYSPKDMIDKMQQAIHDPDHYLHRSFRDVLPNNASYYASLINKWGVFNFSGLEQTMSSESYSNRDVPFHWSLIQIACDTEIYRQGSNGIRSNFLKMVLNNEFNQNYRNGKLETLFKVYDAYQPFKHIQMDYADAKALVDFVSTGNFSPSHWDILLDFVDKADYRDLSLHCRKIHENEYIRKSAEYVKIFAKTAMIYPPITDFLAKGKMSRKQDFLQKLHEWEFNDTQCQYLINALSKDNKVSHELVENKIAYAVWSGVEAKPQEKIDFLLNKGQMQYSIISLAERLGEPSRNLFYNHLLDGLLNHTRLAERDLFEILDHLPRIQQNGEAMDFFEFAVENMEKLRYSDSLLFRYLDKGMDGDLKDRTLLAKDWEECRRVDKLLNGESGFLAGLFASFRGNPKTDLEFAAFKAYMTKDTDSFYAYIGQFVKERGWEHPMAMDHVQLGILMSYCETKNPDLTDYHSQLLLGLKKRGLLGVINGTGKYSGLDYNQIQSYPEKYEVVNNMDKYLFFSNEKSISVQLKQGTASLINKM